MVNLKKKHGIESKVLKMVKEEKNYHIILKTDLYERGTFVKYHSVNNLLRFLSFINDKHPKWVFFHVYNKEGGELLETFKKTSQMIHLPTSKTL